MLCKKCTHSIDMKTECFTVCEGNCSGAYHAHCVGLSEAAVSVIKKNIIWLCDICLESFHAERFQELIECKQDAEHSGPKVEIIKEINELKIQISNITTMLSGYSRRSTLEESLPLHQVSTPLSSPDALNEVLRESSANHTNEGIACTSTERQHSFSLLLSNVNSCVTEQDIDSLVSKSLGITDIDNRTVTKLVPKWKPCEELDYISFKVVLDEKWKTAALRSSTWPPTIKFREFINRQRCTWYPSS